MKKSKKKSISIPIWALTIIICLIVAILAGVILNQKENEITSTILSAELSRTQDYDDVVAGDEAVEDSSGNTIANVQFDAFFLKDKTGDGVAEKVRGTCNEVGSQATLYMDINVIDDGYIKDGKITINSNNFYFKTTIVADNEVPQNYISSNTTEISFNDISNGTEKLMMGSVRSGDYSSSSTVRAAIGNDTSKYSMENSVTFSGTYVLDGVETPFEKTVTFVVDWYGEVNASIYDTSSLRTSTVSSIDDLINDNNELELSFSIATTESKNQLIMAGNYISGTMPELNGYLPTSVKITGTNVTYEYDETTGEFTAQREAVLTGDVVTTNAYSSSNGATRYNYYYFTVTYPIEAYEAYGDEPTTVEIAIPIETVNTGYNNPNTEDGFENPYTSETASAVISRIWKEKAGTVASFDIYVGTYKSSPYYTYVISKEKPLNIYNGISLEETDDTYIVQWRAYTGTNGTTAGIVMSETTGKTDQFLNTSATYISMDELTTNTGIYFSGATSILGSDGWIKVYDADTNVLLETFDSSNWGTYTSSNPYVYENSVKHIRVETSSTNAESYLYVYSIKELDDEYITDNYTREEFDSLSYIYSYLDGYMISESDPTSNYYSESTLNRALYAAPTSIAAIAISEDTISTQVTTENEKITITTTTSGYNQQKWKNGTFLVQLPSDIMLAEINSVTVNNDAVEISAYDIYEEDGNYYIKILTQNEEEATYTITIDCNLTPDPTISRTTGTVKLYATNEIACDYYYSSADTYDIDGDANVTEKVNYRTTTLTLEPGTSLSTIQIGSDYDNTGSVTIAPRVAKTDKNQRTATITVSVTNNYTYSIQDIKIQGVIPFEGNDSILSGQDLGSDFTTYITSGLSIVTADVEDYITIYYSTNENPTNDITLASNEWTLADDVQDWTSIKTYIIVVDSSYVLKTGESLEFKYEINIPEGIDYNEVTYSAHGVYFALATEDGLYYTSTASAKLGFMIAKQYDLEIVKYQEDSSKTIQGVTFTVTEEGAETSTIKVTDADGAIEITGLYVERYYIIQEISTTDDYVLNSEPIRFYTYTVIDSDDNENLYVTYVDDQGNYVDLTQQYDFIKAVQPVNANANAAEDYKIIFEIENEVKAKLKITKTDGDTDEPLKNVRFTLTGEGISTTLKTDENGEIEVSGLYLGEEYTLTEIKATDYYIPDESITFTVTNNSGTFEVAYTDNETTASKEIVLNDEIPTLTLSLENEAIPTYGLQLTKYAEGEETKLEGAQFKIYGEGISDKGEIYATDADGVLTIDGLYEYVDNNGDAKGGITGEYTLVEIYAPEGYTLDATELKFRAYRESGELIVEILEGESVIRTITDSSTEPATISTDLTVTDASSEYPIIEIGVENGPIFYIYKYTTEGVEKVALPGTKFVITDLDGNTVTGSDGNIVGEWDSTVGNYVLTTDESGKITANLAEGYYKAIEVYTNEKYVLEEDEADRTYYFGIGSSQSAKDSHWMKAYAGAGWEYVESIEATDDEGVISVGSFSAYTIDNTVTNGVDLDGDSTTIEAVSKGNADGLIVAYDYKGEYLWSKTIGGDLKDRLTKIVKTSDGGYVVTGYVTSDTIYYNGVEVEELSIDSTDDTEPRSNQDGIIVKISSDGSYEWGLRIGGELDDEINSVIELSNGNIAVVGKFKSSTFSFYQKEDDGSVAIVNSADLTLRGGIDGFVAVYSETGKYQWSQQIGGSYNDEAVDIIETSAGIAVAVNYKSTCYLDTAKSVSQTGSSTSYTNGLVVGYTLGGTYSWRYRFYPSSASYNIEISALEVNSSGNILVAVEYAYILYGSLNGSSTADTIIDTAPTNSVYDASIVELATDGTYTSLVYTLAGNYDDYISDIKATSDEGLLFGGWYYSDGGIDVDGDGDTTGTYDFSTNAGNYASDAFLIKLDSDTGSAGNVIYSNRIYGDAYDNVTAVTELTSGKIAAGGSYNSSTLTVSMLTEDESDVQLLTRNTNSEGFVMAEYLASAEVPEAQSLSIENVAKTFKITTQVKNYETDADFDGGTITGQATTYDGVTYTLEGVRYVETVEYGEDSVTTITIEPLNSYAVSGITINGEEYTSYTLNSDGSVTIALFEEVTEDIHIIAEFSNTVSSIQVNHYLWTEAEGTTTTTVAESETYTGNVGDTYTALPATDIEYEIITNADYYSGWTNYDYYGDDLPTGLVATDAYEPSDPDGYYMPDNYTGTYVSGVTEVINYYYKAKTYTLTVHHYLAGTDEQVPAKDGGTVADEVTEGYTKNQEYKTTQTDLIDYDIYELVETPENSEGTIEENTEVTYYYQIRTVDISITKVAEEDHTQVLSGTEFALYKLIGTSDDSLIDTDDLGDDWTLVGTYTTSSTGILKLEDLQITSEYRLVETKASDGRMKPEGQWKIELIYGDYDTTDTSIISVNGTVLRVTAIGNPPALVLDEGTLLLPNREYYNIPSSGDIGTSSFYQIGASLMIAGLILFIVYKAKFSNVTR